MARFPIDLKINGKVMTYTLPPELTGNNANTIVLTQKTDIHGIRTYTASNASATCMGPNDRPGCVVKHKNLTVNKTDAKTRIEEKFFDPQLQSAALEISDKFESGNEPIGFIGFSSNPRRSGN